MRDGFLYSGVQGGDIVRIPLADVTSKPWQVVTKIGLPCDDLSQESTCGRPLGMEFDPKGKVTTNRTSSVPGLTGGYKYQRSGVPTRDSSSKRILKVSDLSFVEAE